MDWIRRLPARFELSRHFGRYDGGADPWTFVTTKYSPYYFGYKAERDMSNYLRGESVVRVTKPSDIEDWIDSCNFERIDGIWQHPCDLETSKTGSCIGMSLWAWRKFHELGWSACLVIGQRTSNANGHAWLTLESDGVELIFDTVESEGRCFELSNEKEQFLPFFGVETTLVNRLYFGYLDNLRAHHGLD